VLGWLGLRVGFRAANGENHELYFRGEGANAQFIVESEPQPFRVWLASLPSTANLADVALARSPFEQIQALQSASPPAPSPAGAAADPAASDPNVRIPALTNQLALVAARLMPEDGVAPSSPPAYGNLSHGFGTAASVPTLTRRVAPGSEPGSGVAGGLWEALRQRVGRAGGSSYYVRGHLLNHHLGGSGETWANLTPLTQAANNRGVESMYRSFERPVKQAVINDRGTVQNFHVNAVPDQPARGGHLSEIDREIGAAEATLPRARQTARSPDECASSAAWSMPSSTSRCR
jgi:DNA/RNA non-specific endonuclease